jgi:pyrimidine-specific ribonucleoside hydrolase
MGGDALRPTPVIVDCDPGIDDALALAVLAVSPEFDLRAVTTVRGNVPVEDSTRNARRTLAAFGRPEVAVCPGAARPLVRLNRPFSPMHGPNGLGGVELPAAPAEVDSGGERPAAGRAMHKARSVPPADGEAAGAAAESALAAFERVLEPAAPGEITVIALAPLTNIALLLAVRPDLADRIGLLAVMGATLDRGNITPFAEFNVWADPEAACRVLGAGEVPTRLFSLAATRQATVDELHRLKLAGWSPAGAMLAEIIGGYDPEVAAEGWPLHDAIVIAGLLEPPIVELREAAAIEVDTTTGPHRGATTVTWDQPHVLGSPVGDEGHGVARRFPLEVAVDADPERFWELLRERIAPLG